MTNKQFAVGFGSVMATLFAAANASAQMHAMPPDPYDMHSSPTVVQAGPTAQAGQQPAYPASNDYPAAEVQAVPAARARVAMTRAEFDRAQSALHLVVDDLRADFEYSANFLTLLRNEQTAYDHYVAVRNQSLKQLASNSDYHTLASLTKDLGERLVQLQENPQGNRSEILATAELKLAYATKMSDLESDALKNDSATQDAKAQLVEASAKVSDLRAAFQRSLHRDQKFVAAKHDMDDAKIARVTSAALLDGALEARNIAMDYAYYMHNHDPYTYRYTGNNEYDPYLQGFYNEPVYNRFR